MVCAQRECLRAIRIFFNLGDINNEFYNQFYFQCDQTLVNWFDHFFFTVSWVFYGSVSGVYGDPIFLDPLNILSDFGYSLIVIVFIAAECSAVWKESDTTEVGLKAMEIVESLATLPVITRSLNAVAAVAESVPHSMFDKPTVSFNVGVSA